MTKFADDVKDLGAWELGCAPSPTRMRGRVRVRARVGECCITTSQPPITERSIAKSPFVVWLCEVSRLNARSNPTSHPPPNYLPGRGGLQYDD